MVLCKRVLSWWSGHRRGRRGEAAEPRPVQQWGNWEGYMRVTLGIKQKWVFISVLDPQAPYSTYPSFALVDNFCSGSQWSPPHPAQFWYTCPCVILTVCGLDLVTYLEVVEHSKEVGISLRSLPLYSILCCSLLFSNSDEVSCYLWLIEMH